MEGDLGSVAEGSRILYRARFSIRVMEDSVLERSPSGDFVRFKTMGWVSMPELRHYELLEVLGSSDDGDDMCPNCVTPWKCNGPHLPAPCRGAPGGSPELERYLDSLGLSGHMGESGFK